MLKITNLRNANRCSLTLLLVEMTCGSFEANKNLNMGFRKEQSKVSCQLFLLKPRECASLKLNRKVAEESTRKYVINRRKCKKSLYFPFSYPVVKTCHVFWCVSAGIRFRHFAKAQENVAHW